MECVGANWSLTMKMPSRPIRFETARGPREAVEFAGTVERWHVPILGSGQDGLPFLVLEDDCPTVLLFTSRRKANRAVQGWIAPSIDTAVHAAQYTRSEIVAMLSEFAQRGIGWIRINHGPTSVRLPLEAVAGAVRQATRATSLQAIGRLFVLRDPVTPSAPYVEIVHDQPCLRLFTNVHRAEARAKAMGPRLVDDPHAAVVALGEDDVLLLLQRLRSQGVESIMIDGPGGGQHIAIDAALQRRIAA
jgi:hypothetical protein